MSSPGNHMRTAWTHEGSGGGAEKQLLEEEPDQSKLRLEELSPENRVVNTNSLCSSLSLCVSSCTNTVIFYC